MAGTGRYPSVAVSVVVMIITVGMGATAEESAMASSPSPTLEACATLIPIVPTVFVAVIALLSLFFACRSLRHILRLLFGSFLMNPWERRLLFSFTYVLWPIIFFRYITLWVWILWRIYEFWSGGDPTYLVLGTWIFWFIL